MPNQIVDYRNHVSKQLLKELEHRRTQWHLRNKVELLEHLLTWVVNTEPDL